MKRKIRDGMTMKSRYAGFTMIELMIAVAVIGILSAIVYPNYQNYIIRANRGVGEATLLEVASRQEQYFATNATYADALDDLGYAAAYYIDRESEGTNAAGAIYLISVVAGPNAGVAPFTTFSLTATRQNRQTKDDECGDLGLNHRGVKTSTKSGAKCW